MKRMTLAAISGAVMTIAGPVIAGEADVVGVRMAQNGETYRFNVTVRHADAGWDHYADKWEVVTPDGKVIDTRVLAHPHDNEQPFTRSMSDVKISESITEVTVRAHDSVHKYGEKTVKVAVPK